MSLAFMRTKVFEEVGARRVPGQEPALFGAEAPTSWQTVQRTAAFFVTTSSFEIPAPS